MKKLIVVVGLLFNFSLAVAQEPIEVAQDVSLARIESEFSTLFYSELMERADALSPTTSNQGQYHLLEALHSMIEAHKFGNEIKRLEVLLQKYFVDELTCVFDELPIEVQKEMNIKIKNFFIGYEVLPSIWLGLSQPEQDAQVKQFHEIIRMITQDGYGILLRSKPLTEIFIHELRVARHHYEFSIPSYVGEFPPERIKYLRLRGIAQQAFLESLAYIVEEHQLDREAVAQVIRDFDSVTEPYAENARRLTVKLNFSDSRLKTDINPFRMARSAITEVIDFMISEYNLPYVKTGKRKSAGKGYERGKAKPVEALDAKVEARIGEIFSLITKK